MKKLWPWLVGIGIFVILAVVLWFGLGLLRYSHSPATMMGDRIRPYGDYDRYRDNFTDTSWAFPMFSIFGIVLMVGLPLGIVALIVMGIIMLVRAGKKSDSDPMQASPDRPVCPACGQNVQQDWKVCPHCGESLED
ncbi:MAG: hypothetical protein H0S79_25170 [Anaerolineaceae bacterium]|nr:hypothetical protein [Anaerolineaceae bacterium]